MASTSVPSYAPDLFSDEALADPNEHHRSLRELGPLVWLKAPRLSGGGGVLSGQASALAEGGAGGDFAMCVPRAW